jgi:hypothetical protein
MDGKGASLLGMMIMYQVFFDRTNAVEVIGWRWKTYLVVEMEEEERRGAVSSLPAVVEFSCGTLRGMFQKYDDSIEEASGNL